MSLEEIARVTKIPRRSLESLESGRFDDLPGDVFVRGFLRSYARCVDIDGDEVVERYAQCGLSPAPVSSELADSILGAPRRARKVARGTQAPAARQGATAKSEPEKPSKKVTQVLRDAFDLRREPEPVEKAPAIVEEPPVVGHEAVVASEVVVESESERRVRTFVPPRIGFDDEMSRRGPLTLGVIILVIVATLTMSYLLRRPGTSSEGFTQAPVGELAPGEHHA